jgi:solute carrier family 45 protein 1/2/4
MTTLPSHIEIESHDIKITHGEDAKSGAIATHNGTKVLSQVKESHKINEEDAKTGNVSAHNYAKALSDDNSVDHTCSIRFMILLCLPRVAIAVAWSAQWAALGPLLEILLPSSVVQIVQLVGPTSGLLVAPALGVLSDHCTCIYGRRRPFIFLGALTSVICWLLLMHVVDIGYALGDTPERRDWTAALTILCYIWMDITVNITQVPVNLILTDFAGTRQVTAATVGALCSAVGYFLVAVYIFVFGPAHHSPKAFLGMLIGIMSATTGATCLWIDETPLHLPTETRKLSKGEEIHRAFTAVYTGIRDLPPPLGVYFSIMVLTQYGYTSYNGAKGQFFGLVVNRGNSTGADTCGQPHEPICTSAQVAFSDGVQLAGSSDALLIVGLLYLILLPKLVRAYGVQRIILVSIFPQLFLLVMAFCHNVIVDLFIIMGCGITQCTIFSLGMPLILHVIGHNKHNNVGLFAGAFNSALCVGQFLNFFMSAMLVQSPLGYALPIFVGGLATVGAFMLALFKFKIQMHSM